MGKVLVAIFLGMLLNSCSKKDEPFTELTFTPAGTTPDTITIYPDSSTPEEFGTRAFRFTVSSQPAIQSGLIRAWITDTIGATVSTEKMSVGMIPEGGAYTSVGVTTTIHATPKATPGFYTLRIAGSNGKRSAEIFRIVHVL